MKIMATSFKRSCTCTIVFSAPDPATVDPHLHQRLSKSGSGSCGVTASFPCVLVCTRFCLCCPRVISPVLWKVCNQIPLVFKVKFSGGSQSLCQISRLGSLLWALELLQKCENFFGIIGLQFVGHLLGSLSLWSDTNGDPSKRT